MNKVSFKKFTLFILIIVISFSFIFSVPKKVEAQALVFDSVVAAWTAGDTFWKKVTNAAEYAYVKGGAIAFQQTLRSALNKIAIDSATWIASGDKGQKPLFNNLPLDEYFTNIADEAAGQFIESFVKNWNTSHSEGYGSDVDGFQHCIESRDTCLGRAKNVMPSFTRSYEELLEEATNKCLQDYNKCTGAVEKESTVKTRPVAVCQPSSLDVKLRISLGLVEHTRPRAPTCTASDLVKNWSDEIARLDPSTWDDRDWINRLTGIFHPTQSDLGIALNLQTDLDRAQREPLETGKINFMQSGRWLDVVGISGKTESLPGQAEMEAEIAQTSRMDALKVHSGDAFIDAANIFINTLALQYYNRLMQSFGKTVDDLQSSRSANLTDPDLDPSISYSDVNIKEKISQILQPAFSKQADYSIVSDLSLCPDSENPGATNCVIDTNFMQAIAEEKNVITAIKDGSLRANWLLTTDNSKGKDNAYTLRNISILRKHRILPVGWEIAASLNEEKGATLLDLVSCFDINDDYQEFSNSFDLRDTSWCQGLIDPYWVLKAPLSFCQKQGIGGQILNTQILPGQSGMPNSPNILSSLSVTRAESYCADELTCIKEDPSSGACLAYGYCNEEKRIWSFDYPSCEAVYNTCTAFTGPQGAQIAYLENTLDYGICSEENAGCLPYYTRGNYELDNNQISWNTNPLIYFSRKLASCSADNEGCSQLMRVKPSWGSNLIMGADFQYDEIGDSLEANGLINNYWPINGNGTAEIVDGQNLGFNNQKLIRLETATTISLFSDNNNSLLAENFPLIPGYSYTFSADVYVISGSGVKLVIGDNNTFSQTASTGSWQKLFKTYHLDVNNPEISSLDFRIENLSGASVFYLRNLKLEISSWLTNYSPYRSYEIYEKIIPQYLENVCYQDASSATKDYRLKDDAPTICYNFARQCNIDEVGCVMLTNEKYNFSIPAQPVTSDYCPRECESYNVYVAKESHFYNHHAENLIPYNSQVCSVNAVGCTEFTNLDDISSGGERREYYTHLKHCIKPDENKCANFYTWEGDDESGYQLRVMSLEKEGSHPKLTSEDTTCTAESYNLSPWHPGFNPDCRQFYNQAGDVSYRLMTRTITCSDNCHNYRMTNVNTDPETGDVDCKNNGVWSDTHNACLYQAIPGEGKTCNSNMSGCREYSGSDGSNVRTVAAYDFQTSSVDWIGYCDANIPLSNVSVSQNGRSLWYQSDPGFLCDEEGQIIGQNTKENKPYALGTPAKAGDKQEVRVNLAYNLRQNRSYTIKLLAQARADDAQVEFYFSNNNESEDIKFYPDPITIKAGVWQIYELNLPNFNRAVGTEENLIIKSDKDFYIDNIAIKEVSDRFYLISNTSQIPDDCYYDILENYQGADYNLGCSRWTDSLDNSHFLRKISRLCHESSVGCELMIDTNNNSDWRSNTVCDANNDQCVDVEGDKFISAVYDRTKVCLSDNKGCSRMGQVIGEGTNQIINTVYRKNNSENYSDSLCSEEAVACQEWRTDTDFQYFKDPKNNACVYRQSRDTSSSGKFWFMKDVKRCDLGGSNIGSICSDDDDCSEEISCVLDQTDYPCSVSYFETIGLGGLTNRVATPNLQAGICDLEASGCTELIDPVSQFSPNLVFNPSYQGNPAEGWDREEQVISLSPNTLYLFTANTTYVKIEFKRDARGFNLSDNKFADEVVREFNITSTDEKIYFHSQLNNKAKVIGGAPGRIFEVKPVVVDYQLKKNINYDACNSLVNFNNGCVLFNERSFNGASGLAQLNLDAFDSETNSAPKPCTGDECNANQLIKVSPDRTCARWLDCRTYIDDPDTGERICYDLGECTHLNDQNECINYVSFKDDDGDPLTYDYKKYNFHNVTGYSLLDRYFIGEMHEVGLNTSVHYDFETTNIALSCQLGIETEYTEYPELTGYCNFKNNIVADSLVIEPDKATTDYPAQGRGYLKVLAYYQMAPHSENETFQLIPDQKYYINFLLNTKDAGINGRIMLYDFLKREVVWQESASAHNGWERKIFEIDTRELDSGNLQILLTADTNNLEERYVYFDDIHIEPVLKVGPNNYVAKDCRLYPEIDSLNCSSVNDNIIKQGLEGYCLERDPVNSNVCLTWYPVDHISSSQLTSSVGGYQGKQPLYYCAEANANFNLLEKRVPIKIAEGDWKELRKLIVGGEFDSFHTFIDEVDWHLKIKVNKTFQQVCLLAPQFYCFVPGELEYNYTALFEINGDRAAMYCVPDLNKISSDFTRDKVPSGPIATPVSLPNSLNVCDSATADDLGKVFYDDTFGKMYPFNPSKSEDRDINITPGIYEIWDKFDGFMIHSFPPPNHSTCTDCGMVINEMENHDPPLAIYDLNNPPEFEDDLKFIAHNDPDKVYQLTCNRFVQLVDPYGANKAWANRVSQSPTPYLTPEWMTESIENHPFYDVSTNIDVSYCKFKDSYPDCRQDYSCNTTNEGFNTCEYDLDYGWEPYNCCADIKEDGCQPDFPPSCSQNDYNFGADVRCEVNLNYCLDINDPNTCDNDDWCEYVEPLEYDVNKPFIRFGQNREDVPYGAAILPENFDFYSSLPVPFRNQYSDKNNQTIFAGRPYGCDGLSCANIGQCSLNPNVYCILDAPTFSRVGSSKINYDSCAKGNFGTCTPLWQGNYDWLTSNNNVNTVNNDRSLFFEFPLRTLFLKSYGGFEFDYGEEGGYESGKGFDCIGNEDYFNNGSSNDLDCNQITQCLNDTRGENEWCLIFPEIKNVKLYRVGEKDEAIEQNPDGTIDIRETGLYYLEFNSNVDLEQQPLSQIEINWGDGNFQVLADQSHKPNSDNPHRIYHFYSRTNDVEDFNIKIVDNWGAYDLYLDNTRW